MDKKKKKIQKKVECIDCKKKTTDFYKIPTNKGGIHKCANCYELWILRSTRSYAGQSRSHNEE